MQPADHLDGLAGLQDGVHVGHASKRGHREKGCAPIGTPRAAWPVDHPSKGRRMQFGLFGGARTKRSVGLEDSQGYESFIDYVTEADRLGFKQLFMVEHHFTGQGQVSASMTVLAYLAAGPSTSGSAPRWSCCRGTIRC